MELLRSKKHFKMALSLFVLLFLWVTWFTSMNVLTKNEERSDSRRNVLKLWKKKTTTNMASISPVGKMTNPISSVNSSPEIKRIKNRPYLYQANLGPSTKVVFGDKKGSPRVKMSFGDSFLSFSLRQEKNLKPSKFRKNVLIYVLSSLEGRLEYSLLSNSVKENLTLEEKPKTNRFIFDFKSNNLAFVKNNDGSYSFYGKDSLEKFGISRPVAVDAGGKKQPLDMDIAGSTLTLTIDSAWLNNVTYPVVIDPTTIATGTGDPESTAIPSQRAVFRDDDGYWYVSYEVVDGSYSSVRLTRSTNTAGTAWGTEIPLAGPTGTSTTYHFEPGANHQYDPSIFLERTGNVSTNRLHVSWQNMAVTNRKVAYTMIENPTQARMGDANNWKKGDQTTQGYEDIGSGSGTAQGYYPSIVLTSTGKVAIVSHGRISGSSVLRIWYNRYNGGWLASAVAVVDESSTNQYPSLAIDSSDTLHLAWTSTGETPDQVQYKKVAFSSADTASNWTKRDGTAGFDVVINQGTNNTIFPRIAIDENDRAWVVTDIATSLDIWYNYSTSATAWNDNTGQSLDTTGNLYYATVGFGTNDKAYVVYADNSNLDVVYKSSSITGTPSFGGKSVLYNGSNTQYYPNVEANPKSTFNPYIGVIWTNYTGTQYDVLFDTIPIFGPLLGFIFILGFALFLHHKGFLQPDSLSFKEK